MVQQRARSTLPLSKAVNRLGLLLCAFMLLNVLLLSSAPPAPSKLRQGPITISPAARPRVRPNPWVNKIRSRLLPNPPPAPSSPPSSPVYPSKDTYVRNGPHLHQNHGGETSLVVKSDFSAPGLARRSYVEWKDVPPSSKLSATFGVKDRSGGFDEDVGVVICKLRGGAWKEGEIRWENKPAPDLASCSLSPALVRVGSPVCFNIPPGWVVSGTVSVVAMLVPPDGKAEFLPPPPGEDDAAVKVRRKAVLDRVRSGDWASFHSRESAKVHLRPKLTSHEHDCSPLHVPESPFPVLGKPHSQTNTLMVVSTCNEVAHTLKMVETLEKSNDSFDVLFVDDASSDGTPRLLRRLGYAVITKEEPLGLTHSWNLGYEFFVSGGGGTHYDFLIVANNE